MRKIRVEDAIGQTLCHASAPFSIICLPDDQADKLIIILESMPFYRRFL